MYDKEINNVILKFARAQGDTRCDFKKNIV